MRGMRTGDVALEWAHEQHEQWAEEVE